MNRNGTKTNHQTGYHKPIKNPTCNYPKSTHKEFCLRCMVHNYGRCPDTGTLRAKKNCSL